MPEVILLPPTYLLGKMSNHSTEKKTIQARSFLEGTNSSAEMLITDNWRGFLTQEPDFLEVEERVLHPTNVYRCLKQFLPSPQHPSPNLL